MAMPPGQPAPKSLEERAEQQFGEFLSDCGLAPERTRSKRILELGFGNGLFLNECRKAGMVVTGLEVRERVYETTCRRFDQMDLRLYDGSTIPADDDYFDFIVSFQVLEHVEQLELLLEHCIRVLKPGGYMYHRLPNYQSFYEGHYNILWLPFLTKSSGRRYMKLIGKYTDYYETLNIIKPAHVRRLCDRSNGRLELISDGKDQFRRHFNAHSTEKIQSKLVRSLTGPVVRFAPLRELLYHLLLRLDMYYPMLLLARKKDPTKGV